MKNDNEQQRIAAYLDGLQVKVNACIAGVAIHKWGGNGKDI
jgi:hypothetical protein